MKKRLPVTLLLLLTSLLLPACGGSAASTNGKSFDVELKATSDDGELLEGVKFATSSSTIGTSNAKGTVSVNMKGSDGQSLPITTTCPDGYVGPEQTSTLKLTEVRRVNQENPSALGIAVTCTRKLREVVLVVRTTNAASLPVDVGGKTVGTTDENGNAHVRLQLDREVRSLSVSLGTNDSPALRPQNPSRVYELDGQDAILLVDQSFTIDRKVVVKKRVASSVPRAKHIPYKIDSGRSRGF